MAAGTRVRYLGDYEILEEIDRGGMGVVYRARQTTLDRLVALKVILEGEFASEAAVRRFRREAEAAAQLDHPNIVPIYEVGEHEGTQYFSMKLIEGRSLRDLVDAYVDKPRATAELMRKIALAVDHAHRCGVVHRDLKPANVLIDDAGEPHLTDFGLARRFTDPSALTMSTAIAGTPSYMAPEQAAGGPVVTTAVDVYAIGAILYHLLTGRPPFSGDSVLDTLRMVAEGEPRMPRLVRREVERDLEAIALRCMQKRPEQRYRTAAEVADDLLRFLEGKSTTARPITWASRAGKWTRRHRRAIAIAAAAVAVVLAGSRMYVSARNEAERERSGDRIRAILEESIATNTLRASLRGYWPSFESDVDGYLRAAPDDETEMLLRRSAAHVVAEVNPFGLIDNPPPVKLSYFCQPAPARVLALLRVEASLDGGKWKPVSGSQCLSDRRIEGFCEALVPLERTTTTPIQRGPHRLALRAVIRSYDAGSFSTPLSSGCGGGGYVEPIGLRSKRAMTTETRRIGEFPVVLSDSFPEYFPRPLPLSELGPDSFRVRAIRIASAVFEAGQECVPARWFAEKRVEAVTVCRPMPIGEKERVAVRVELSGTFDHASVPLAGIARIGLDTHAGEEVAFEFVFGGGRAHHLDPDFHEGLRIYPGVTPFPSSRVSQLQISLTDRLASLTREPGRYDGVFILDPSRDIALETRQIDRYIGERIEVQVPVEIVDIGTEGRSSTNPPIVRIHSRD